MYYKVKRRADAREATDWGSRFGTQEASLFFHAGMMAEQKGKVEQAKCYRELALEANPDLSLVGAGQAWQTLSLRQSIDRELGSTTPAF